MEILDPPPEEIINKFHRPNLIYSDVKIIVTAIITLTIIICSSSIIIICMKIRKFNILTEKKLLIEQQKMSTTSLLSFSFFWFSLPEGQRKRQKKEKTETLKKAQEIQRDRYYATMPICNIGKV